MMFIGCEWVHLVPSAMEWKYREKQSLLRMVKVYGEALKLFSPSHESDSRTEKENNLITQNSVGGL